MPPKTTCELGRRSAYSEDLRWRIVWQREVLGYKYGQVASNLNVDVSTVWRIVKLFQETGCVDKKKYPQQRAFRKLTTPLQLTVLHLVLERPGIYLREIHSELFELAGADISYSQICRFLSDMGFSRQKIKYTALQRDQRLRFLYKNDVSVYHPDMLIFLDESGFDRRDGMRKYGYSLRGRPPISHKLMARGKHLSLMAFMSTTGILDCKITDDGVDGDAIYNFVERHLLPHLMPFDGHNPHSVLVMDNCAIHHVSSTVEMIYETGAIVHFLPPTPLTTTQSKAYFQR